MYYEETFVSCVYIYIYIYIIQLTYNHTYSDALEMLEFDGSVISKARAGAAVGLRCAVVFVI